MANVRSVIDSAAKTYGATLTELSDRNAFRRKALGHVLARPVTARTAVKTINAMLNSRVARAWRRRSYSTVTADGRLLRPRDRPVHVWRRILETLLPDRIERELADVLKRFPPDGDCSLASFVVRGLANKGIIPPSKQRRAETWLSRSLSDLRIRSLPVARLTVRPDGKLSGLPEPHLF